MDWWLLLIVAVGAYLVSQHRKRTESAQKARTQLDKDTRLLQHIKMAKREYEFAKRDEAMRFPEHGELLFETAHYSVYKVRHFAESRLGFHFKDIEEYGLYGSFVGDPGEYYDSYYRTDITFQKEHRLLTRDE